MSEIQDAPLLDKRDLARFTKLGRRAHYGCLSDPNGFGLMASTPSFATCFEKVTTRLEKADATCSQLLELLLRQSALAAAKSYERFVFEVAGIGGSPQGA